MTRAAWLLSLAMVLLGAALLAFYTYDNSRYVATDNATVVAPMSVVASPAAGTVTALDLPVGTVVHKGERLAQVRTPQAIVRTVLAPSTARVAAEYATVGDSVAAGQELGALTATARSVVVANVAETDAGRVHVGQRADLAFPDDPSSVRGVVTRVGRAVIATASSPGLPTLTTANATEYVPVTIRFAKGGLRVVDGMSVTVRIHV